MSRESRTRIDGFGDIGREDWITKFVNVVVIELRPGFERMRAVAAARAEWPQMRDASPSDAARRWASHLP